MKRETRRTAQRALFCALLASVPALAWAQPAPGTPPTGPAQIMQQATQGRDRADMKRAAQAGEAAAQKAEAQAAPAAPSTPAPTSVPASQAPSATPAASAPAAQAPTAAPAPSGAPHDAVHAGAHAGMGAQQDMPSAEPAPELPKGTIAIQVVGPNGQPYPDAEIVLGVMASMGGRTEQRAKSSADGQYTFKNLGVGSQQAYRVNVLFGGAKFSSTPFRLPDAGGYRVRIPLHETTHDQRMVFQMIGQILVELRDDRLHVTQQARLVNAGSSVFVLPPEGMLMPLPSGFTAFQWEDQMTDQRAEEDKGKGFRLRGSLPPGAVTLGWAYDLERSGANARIPVDLPFRTFTFRVISEAPEGMKLRVNGFPEPERVKDEGRDLAFTQLRRTPTEGEIGSFTIKLEGIPGPGPGRWISLALALLAVAYGLVRAFQRGDDAKERRTVLALRKQHLLDAAKQAEQELARGDIGPEYHARRMDELTTELAMVLRDEEAIGAR